MTEALTFGAMLALCVYATVSAYRLGVRTGELKGQIHALQLLDKIEAAQRGEPVDG